MSSEPRSPLDLLEPASNSGTLNGTTSDDSVDEPCQCPHPSAPICTHVFRLNNSQVSMLQVSVFSRTVRPILSDVCSCQQDIVGNRFHCITCDIDICSHCEDAGLPGDVDASGGRHNPSHIMLKVIRPSYMLESANFRGRFQCRSTLGST